MNRKLSLFLFLLFVLLSSNHALAETNLTKIVKKIQSAVVTVITYDKDNKPLGQGSGFFIDNKGHLITNYHVLKGAYSAEVKTYSGKKYPINFIIADNEISDLVKILVDIPEKSFSWLKVTEAIPDVAERILVVGTPMGLEQSVSEGIVSAVRELPKAGKIYQISAPISPGSSGSPVINMKGEVIGVATLYLLEGQNLNFAISGKHILNIKQKKDSRTVAEWTEGLRTKKVGASDELYKKGHSFYLLGEYKKAIPFFKKALEKEPNNYEILFYLGVAYGKLGLYMDAIEAYKQTIRIKPDDADAHYGLGVNYDELGLHRDAMEAYKQAIRIKPDFAEAHHNLGANYGDLGLHRDAIEAYKQAIRIKPDFAKTHLNLGLTYGDLGLYRDAIEAFKQAIRIKPDYADAHYNLGFYYIKFGLYRDAIEAFKQAIRIKPDFANAHLNLGLTYLILGNKGAALDEYKILKGIDKGLADKLFNFIYK